MENKVKEGQDKLSYDELKNVAAQLKNEAEMWKRKAYEEAGKTNRISLILECLKLQCSSYDYSKDLFLQEEIGVMTNELYEVLYPKEGDKEIKACDDK